MDSGALWFQNLASYDPYCRLPIISGIIFAINFEYLNDAVMKPLAKNIMRGTLAAMSIGGAYLTYEFALGLHVYWTTSVFFTVLINYVLRRTRLREYFNIPRIDPAVKPMDPFHDKPVFKTIKEEVTFANKPTKQKNLSNIHAPSNKNKSA